MMQAHGGAARSKLVDLLAVPEPSTIHPTAVRRQHLRLDDSTRWDHIELDIIAVHQHAGAFTLGKSEPAGLAGDPSLAYGLALAHAGARVVLPDLIGFEERQRHWSNDPSADERLDALFRVTDGSSLQAKHTHDIAVVTSWMRESDSPASQLSVIGHSLGGQVALFSLALDPRISRGVVSCGLGTLASFEAARIRHNPAWFVPWAQIGRKRCARRGRRRSPGLYRRGTCGQAVPNGRSTRGVRRVSSRTADSASI